MGADRSLDVIAGRFRHHRRPWPSLNGTRAGG